MIPRVLGVDLALSKTGVALPDGRLETFTTRPRDGYHRLETVRANVADYCRACNVELVVIEDYAPHGPGINSTIALAELGGVVRLWLTREGPPWWVKVNPVLLKRFATGHGGAKKPEMLDAAQRATASTTSEHHRPGNDNEADAYWLRQMALTHYGRAPRLGYQNDALAGVDWPELSP